MVKKILILIQKDSVTQNNINYIYFHSKMRPYKGEPYKEPECPYCYNGVIKEDKAISGVFFCCTCLREVIIKKFGE